MSLCGTIAGLPMLDCCGCDPTTGAGGATSFDYVVNPQGSPGSGEPGQTVQLAPGHWHITIVSELDGSGFFGPFFIAVEARNPSNEWTDVDPPDANGGFADGSYNMSTITFGGTTSGNTIIRPCARVTIVFHVGNSEPHIYPTYIAAHGELIAPPP